MVRRLDRRTIWLTLVSLSVLAAGGYALAWLNSSPAAPASCPVGGGEPPGPPVAEAEAEAIVGFDVILPSDLPPGTQLEGIWVVEGAARSVEIHFSGELVLLEERSAQTRPDPQGLEFETVVDGFPALGVRGDVPASNCAPVSQLQWWTGQVLYDLFGPVAFEEIEAIAYSM